MGDFKAVVDTRREYYTGQIKINSRRHKNSYNSERALIKLFQEIEIERLKYKYKKDKMHLC